MDYRVALAGAFLAAFVLRQLYHALFGPLARLPGPFISRLTPLQFQWNMLNGRAHYYTKSLHDTYGPIVRAAPNLVIVTDSRFVKEINKVPVAYRKAKWYDDLNRGLSNLFAMRNVQDHAARRRLMAGPMSESSIRLMEPRVQNKVDTAISRMVEAQSSKGYMDVWRWTHAFVMDTITDLSLGESVGLLTNDTVPRFVDDFSTITEIAFPCAAMPWLYNPIANMSWLNSGVNAAVVRVLSHARNALHNTSAFVNADYEKAMATPTIFTKMLHAKTTETISEFDIVQEMLNTILAGTDTTTATTASLFWAMARRPDLQTRMVEALSKLETCDNQNLKNCRFLDNVMEETLRLHGSGNGFWPREVPESGAQMGPYFLRAGVNIAASPYTMHRDPKAFPDPLVFNPDRWEHPSQAMRDNFQPWGGGSRACVGISIAKMELRLLVAAYYKRFPKTSISHLANPRDMDETRNYALIAPAGRKTLIQVDQMS